MKKPNPIIRNRQQSERRLREAALRIFSERGYDAASVQEVASEAGVNVSLINRYFGGKRGLLLSVIDAFIKNKQSAPLPYPPQLGLYLELVSYLSFRLLEDRKNEELIRVLVSQSLTNDEIRKHVRKQLTEKSDENFCQRLEGLRRNGLISDKVDLNAIFSMVSLFSFATNVVGHQMLGVSLQQTNNSLASFASLVAVGVEANVFDSK